MCGRKICIKRLHYFKSLISSAYSGFYFNLIFENVIGKYLRKIKCIQICICESGII